MCVRVRVTAQVLFKFKCNEANIKWALNKNAIMWLQEEAVFKSQNTSLPARIMGDSQNRDRER